MKAQIYQVLHVVSVILLVGVSFFACAAPVSGRKKAYAILSGILGLIALVAGFGLISTQYSNHFQPWMFAKMGIWVALLGVGHAVFRQPSKGAIFAIVIGLLAALAVFLVYVKPFTI